MSEAEASSTPVLARPAPAAESLPEAVADPAGAPSARSLRRQFARGLLFGGMIVAAAGAAALVFDELETSRLQSRWLADFAAGIGHAVLPGPSPQPLVPDTGPYDERLGYARLPELLPRLRAAGYAIHAQAVPSPRLRSLHERGLHVLYSEKSQAGLRIRDADGALLVDARYPRRVYGQYLEIPPLVAHSLVFVEDRELLDLDRPYMNPVMDWERLTKAVGLSVLNRLRADDRAIGASTLATQMEKFRHSPDGITRSASDKFRQMASATLRVYRLGAATVPARRQLLLDYLNSLPLAALSGYGEVASLGDGLEAWYGSDFDEVNRVLRDARAPLRLRGLYYKQVLSLILSVRRPGFYLMRDVAALERLTNSYLRVMAQAGVIDRPLRDAALAARLRKRSVAVDRPMVDFARQKGPNLIRNRLLRHLGVASYYELDRLDLDVTASLDARLQRDITTFLGSLGDPAMVKALGLDGARLLADDDPTKVVYSFTLYERGANGNRIRVNADNLAQPLDINSGAKLDLGSTAKLRTLVTYLQLVAEIHDNYTRLPAIDQVALPIHPKDQLSAWVIDYLRTHPDATLTSVLEASLLRTWSASSGQVFFTGGGAHRFANFERSDNGRVMTLQEALRRSVNLVFIRVMREVVDHYLYRAPSTTARLLENADDPERSDYLRRFADREGQIYLRRFYAKYQGKSADEALAAAFDGVRVTPRAVAVVLRSVRPNATVEELGAWIARAVTAAPVAADVVADLYARYPRTAFDLEDRAYLARVHPLELWLLEYLHAHPGASRAEVMAAGAETRQQVYSWLMRANKRRAQDRRILDLLEIEAFQQIHAAWQRLGYPFASLTPSLATSIGSSGDRPAALAELMGILQNDGVRLPVVLVEDYRFGATTPYETQLRWAGLPEAAQGERIGERVLPVEVARVARRAITDVVENGTARSLVPQLQRADGTRYVVGGKTGTGDHRFESFSGGGRVVESRVVNRVATFMFFIDERFFGTITAFVPGEQAANYQFTSGLVVRLLGALMPTLAPRLDLGRPVAPRAVAEAVPDSVLPADAADVRTTTAPPASVPGIAAGTPRSR